MILWPVVSFLFKSRSNSAKTKCSEIRAKRERSDQWVFVRTFDLETQRIITGLFFHDSALDAGERKLRRASSSVGQFYCRFGPHEDH